ncbi:ribosomal protein L22 [Rubrobacter radiotolerans]|uniref:Large ribosomal subunit protein uL22 n=1 Tax=Rubrobacter radiotolerans TaxID=42256 RepID=A0A023X4S9_RUBRA|nr:50S ribosomal protein L22 [Rubrobacter radiotolerans]AHY47221.1 ribosomal protein L22 [Rubrobacter radiotolerans]MDX5894624.1 50S ribosomal protein L22 [Rubrobacter radiotolerans]SMC06418.1 large subunit ribosomal protein L22 [Rubrobacter radiotolerans DSM 5868]
MKAIAKYVRIAPRKARLVADAVRGKSVPVALAELQYTNKKAAGIVNDVIRSAAANAEHNDGLDPDELFVTEIRVDEGPTIKRYRPRAMGRATMIRKRTSHVSVKLGSSPKVLVGAGAATDTPGDEEEN